MTEIKNQTGTKKKLLIPVVVLMLLGVGLAGAAYAYNSTVTVNGNGLTSESFVLEVKNEGGTALLTDPISIKGIDFTTATVIGTPDGVDVVANTLTASNTYKGMLVINDSDAANGETPLTVTAKAKIGSAEAAVSATGEITAAEIGNGATGGPIHYTVAVALYTNIACTQQYAYTDTVTFANHAATLYYVVTVTAADSVHFANATPVDDVGYVKTALASETFSLLFTAEAP